ncbi:hypothetical protein GYH30_027617 [Glycine max]|nr:hypothetical protein GYH30_027617 [Glycine max]
MMQYHEILDFINMSWFRCTWSSNHGDSCCQSSFQ